MVSFTKCVKTGKSVYLLYGDAMEAGPQSRKIDFSFNTVYVIESFKDGEKKCGKELYEDTLRWQSIRNRSFKSCYNDISSFRELEKTFFEIRSEVRKGMCPVLHFDMHGDKEGVSLKNGDHVDWPYLNGVFQDINIKLKNNLFVTMGTCHGANVVKSYVVTQPACMLGFLGFSKK
ncbi:hypothetical protein [Solidesulfovibrio magneticus]|uniref:hypothetical protein n=1 Tax=Solidesulfovibrio magneticus TaxID=184917 RepID=UPI0011D167A2|nr:hypothetical protein [Solidesulfovibrio magneticus]